MDQKALLRKLRYLAIGAAVVMAAVNVAMGGSVTDAIGKVIASIISIP